jgi:hypothetical protein
MANALPFKTTPEAVILAWAMIVPSKDETVPSVAEVPRAQKTFCA